MSLNHLKTSLTSPGFKKQKSAEILELLWTWDIFQTSFTQLSSSELSMQPFIDLSACFQNLLLSGYSSVCATSVITFLIEIYCYFMFGTFHQFAQKLQFLPEPIVKITIIHLLRIILSIKHFSYTTANNILM